MAQTCFFHFSKTNIQKMKNTIEHIALRPCIMLIVIWLMGNIQTVFGQFQTTLGSPYPIAEHSPGGIITPSGDFLILGDNSDLFNGTGDMQLDWLDNAGNFNASAQNYSFPGIENAAWIEKNIFCSGNHYVIAGTDQDNMLVTFTDLSGTPIWTRSIGSPNDIETSAWVEMDANGLIELVGTKFDATTGISSVAMAQLDCNGNDNWRNTFSVNGYSLVAMSATTFPTIPGGQGICFITGKATPLAGGDDQLFILRVNTSAGFPTFLKTYDVASNSNDVGTCIQGSTLINPQGELWVSGYSDDINGLKNVLMLKTDLNGTPVWAKNYDITGGDEFAKHFEFDGNGKIVLTGRALESTVFQGTKGGDCMLMRMDASGNSIDWTRVFTNNGFSSQGNRVEVTSSNEYFITGNALELLTPSQSAGNILAIRTDANGQTSNNCYQDETTQIISRMALVNNVPLPAFILGAMANNLPKPLPTISSFNDTIATSCSALPSPCDCDVTWTNTGCFNGFFTVTCMPATGGNYKYEWDYDCGGPLPPAAPIFALNSNPLGSPFVQTFPYTFPCGGGSFTACLKLTTPNGIICNYMQTVVVPNTCCGAVSGTMDCHPSIPYKYNFTINVTDPQNATNCTHVLTSPYTLSNLVYAGNTITGCVAVPDPIPLNIGFTLQTNCLCPTTGLPFTCTQPFNVATVCCKQIHVDDQVVCDEADSYDVPIGIWSWPPLNMVYQVSWYVMPKPPSGICPSAPWGGQPYQSTIVSNILEPLHLFPNTLPSDLCIYAVVDLNDGPCTQLTSNIAMLQLCKPNSCTLNSKDYCYDGNCIPPDPIILSSSGTPPTCFSSVDWFEGTNSIAVQNGGSTYQPPCLSMANDQDCYEDFIYTAVITDACGQHECKSRIRLYSKNAPIGTLDIIPVKTPPLCFGEDATLKFTPKCLDNPPGWAWYKRDCSGAVAVLADAGLMNMCYNVNELYNGEWYGVAAKNGVCPIKTEELEIQVIEPASLQSFDAVADPCAEVQVLLSASVIPGLISCTNASFPCTYTYEWYKDGFLIGTTHVGSASESFTYFNPLPLPSTLAGNYYAIIKEECCPDNILSTWDVPIRQACEPVVMGPCFICDGQSENFMVQMVLPPNKPCPDVCSFTWYTAILDVNGHCIPDQIIGTNASITLSTAGHYFVESNCNGCIKLMKFDVLACMSGHQPGQTTCGAVSVEELMSTEESPLHIFPNPTTGELNLEWSGNAPKNAQIYITDPMGRRLRMITVPEGTNSLSTQIDDLPSGLYFVKVQSTDRLFTVAKLVKE